MKHINIFIVFIFCLSLNFMLSTSAFCTQNSLQGTWSISINDTIDKMIENTGETLPSHKIALQRANLEKNLAGFSLYFDLKEMKLITTIDGETDETSITITGKNNTFVIEDASGSKITVELKGNRLYYFTDETTLILKRVE